MFIVFLLCLIAVAAILYGARATGALVGFISVAAIGGLLIYHMTDTLPIGL